MFSNFTTTTHGKWILAGEHAVLRGHPALVFPLKSHQLTLEYQATTAALTLTSDGLQSDHLSDIVWRVITAGLAELEQPTALPRGLLKIKNQIPLGAGLGASAALCVAIARWLQAQYAPSLEVFLFARQLENLFHGQSSGLDIAGASAMQGVLFQQGNLRSVPMTWSPCWILSSSGEVGITSASIRQLDTQRVKNPASADALDQRMAHSVALAHQALLQQDKQLLATAINQAHDCFLDWGLITPALAAHMHTLRQAGALAVKPTGSGNGGYVLSLWEQLPLARDLSANFIPIEWA